MQSPAPVAELLNDESGHATPALGAVIAAAGIVVLSIGAANDTGWLTVAGGIVGGVGLLAASVLNHLKVDWGILGRLDNLENQKK